MEFWGIEIKPGKPFEVEVEDGYILHISQISLGETEKVGDETVQVYAKIIDTNCKEQTHLLGNLSQKIPQVSLDIIFEIGVDIFHECKNSSVYVLGYKAPDHSYNSEIDSDDEDIPMERFQSELKKSEANGESDQKASDEEEESDSDEMGSDDDEDDSEEEEETPVKVDLPGKKNKPNGGAMSNNKNASKKGGHKGHKCGGVHPPKRN